jgi:hypothetical protein
MSDAAANLSLDEKQRILGDEAYMRAALRVLADVVEPGKDYTREQTAPVEPTSLNAGRRRPSRPRLCRSSRACTLCMESRTARAGGASEDAESTIIADGGAIGREARSRPARAKPFAHEIGMELL